MASRHETIKARLLATFAVEAQEHLQTLTASLLTLHGAPSPAESREVIETTFRVMHTLKGAARAVSLLEIEALCQGMETILHRITREDLPLNPTVLACLQEGVDGVGHMLSGGEHQGVHALTARLEQVATGPAETTAMVPAVPAPREETPVPALAPGLAPAATLRLSTAALDTLFLRAEELLVHKLATGERLQEGKALAEAFTQCRMTMTRARTGLKTLLPDTQALDILTQLETRLREVETQVRTLCNHLMHDERAITGTIEGLLIDVRQLRMTPVSTVLDLFPRMVDDLAHEQGKEVEWLAHGTTLEVDRKVFEAMKDPLIHLVRNAIDHGIELPQTRLQAGKAPRGRVTVTVTPLEGSRFEICVQEDGRGLDLTQIKAEAVRSRLLSAEESANLTDAAAIELLYRAGFSTSPIITNVSGRGLGLAIVKERVEALGGALHLETRAGAGTTVRMLLPATIATFRGLLVQAGEQLFLLPTEAVERVSRITRHEIESLDGHEVLRYHGSLLSLVRLSTLLELPEPATEQISEQKAWCVILRSGMERAAFLVTLVLGSREGLVKEFRPPLRRVRNVAGASLLGTSQMVLILRPMDLIRSLRGRPHALPPALTPEQERRQPVILVVDDSITTRTMEKNLLEIAGYQVHVAVDGEDGWMVLQREAVDLVLSDVDMPRLNGFELTARIRAHAQLSNLPVVLVTALASRDDQERGVEVGANAYIVKASFDQSNLLEVIRRLV